MIIVHISTIHMQDQRDAVVAVAMPNGVGVSACQGSSLVNGPDPDGLRTSISGQRASFGESGATRKLSATPNGPAAIWPTEAG